MSSKILLGLQILIFCISAVGCSSSGDSDDPGSGNSSLDLNSQVLTASADGSGNAIFSFALPAGSSSMQLVGDQGSLIGLVGPQGNLLAQGGFVSTSQRGAVSNVPYSVGGISAGAYTATYLTSPGARMSLQVFSKSDANLSAGTLKLNIVFLGPVAGSADIFDATEEALEVVRITYGRAGMLIDEALSNFDGPGVAPEPGDPLYQSIVASQRAGSVTVVLASERRGSKREELEYGNLGSTPFPVVGSADSVVVIAIQDITGGDGLFDFGGEGGTREHNDEKRLLGEEIARFSARAMGLQNIITLRGNDATASDDLSDTAGCVTQTACRDDDDARVNLMFPEPLEKQDEDRQRRGREYYPRDQLTAQQKQVLNNSVFVD